MLTDEQVEGLREATACWPTDEDASWNALGDYCELYDSVAVSLTIVAQHDELARLRTEVERLRSGVTEASL